MKSRLAQFVFTYTTLSLAGPAVAAEPILTWKSSGWKYCERDPGEGRKWQTAAFDDANWPEGKGILGYGDRDIQTRLSFGGDPQNKHPAAFFRRRVRVAQRGRFRCYLANVRCDDGTVVYLNGKEVYRYNMPAGPVTNTSFALRTFATDPKTERQPHRFLVDSHLLHDGENVIAVSVHQANPLSSDLAFDMELVGLESDLEVQDAQADLQDKATHVDQSTQAKIQSGPVIKFTVTAP